MEKGDITYRINGCAMKVHRVLGNGFKEAIYQRCLAMELEAEGIKFEREVDQGVYYNNKKVGSARADFIVEGEVSVELKAVIKLEPRDLAQAKNYVKAFDFKKGLLINFGAPSLEHNLMFNPKYYPNKKDEFSGATSDHSIQ